MEADLLHLDDGRSARAVVAPRFGGWLLGYARLLEDRGWEEALYWTPEAVERYPETIYAGNPVLFPLAGRNRAEDRDHRYRWQEHVWEMPQHGFARRRPWQIVESRKESITLELRDDDDTRRNYPFYFVYRLTYRLADGRLHWDQTVENHGPERMPFSSGFHPYVYVPLTPGGKRSDCRVLLPACREVTPIGSWDGYRKGSASPRTVGVNDPFTGTLFFTDLEKRELRLSDPGRGLEIGLNFEGASQYRFVALWTRSPDSPFFCLEPWTALPNSFSRMEDLIVLEPGEDFRASLWLEVVATGSVG